MINIVDKRDCCGCTACYNACPKNVITMKKDEEGFLYPEVDNASCINCGKCDKVCPIKENKVNTELLEAYAVQHNDSETLYHSAAGGAFSAIAKTIIDQGGVVYGAGYENGMVVKHSKAEKEEEVSKFRSSKYVQSQQDEIYKDVKVNLMAERWVCYSGTPCQVAGLKKYLGKNYEKLITVDIVCKGVGSPEVLRQYVELMEKKYQSRIIGMNFKRKTYGYHSSTMSIDFENGKTYSQGGITDPMMRSFRANICLRPSCASCQFKGVDRISDLTIFDCWHYSELSGEKDDDRGHTAVLVHSLKGKHLLNTMNDNLTIVQIDSRKAIQLDGIMVCNCAEENPKRTEYFKILNNTGILMAIYKTIPVTLSDRIKERSKVFLYKTKLLSIAKKLFARG